MFTELNMRQAHVKKSVIISKTGTEMADWFYGPSGCSETDCYKCV